MVPLAIFSLDESIVNHQDLVTAGEAAARRGPASAAQAEERALSLPHLADRFGVSHQVGWLRDPSPSWRSAIMTSLGTAHARLGDPEQASGLPGTALELAREAASPYRERMVRVAYQRQLAHSDSAAVKALGDQLR
jgi:hypothetical protein